MALPVYQVNPAQLAITGTGATALTNNLDQISSGHVALLHVMQDGTGTDATISSVNANMANLAGTGSSMDKIGVFDIGNPVAAKHHIWIGRASAQIAISATVCNLTSSSGDDLYASVYTVTNVSTGTTLATVIENGSAGSTASEAGTGTSVPDVGVTTLGSDRLACNLVGINDDSTGLAAFAGASGGTWVLRGIFESATGTDGTSALITADMASAGTVNGGSDTITSDGWGVVGFALIGTTVDAPVPRHSAANHQNPALLMERLKDTWQRRKGSILVPDLWLPKPG